MKYLVIILSSIFLISCGPNHDGDNAIENGIILNQGEKWSVNEEMKPFIEKANIFLEEYIANGDKDYKVLSEKLKNQNTQLISNCNMSGPSHDELHKWLHPHMKLVADLGKADNDSDADVIVQKLSESFKTYKEYFE